MSYRTRAILGVGIFVLGTATAPAAAQEGDVMVEEMGFRTRSGKSVEFELGTLYAPENRSDPDSREIRVSFARFPSHQQPPPAPPVFRLPGGPGSSYVMWLAEGEDEARQDNVLEDVEAYRAFSDVVLVDQRGFSREGDVLVGQMPMPAGELTRAAQEAAFAAWAREVTAQHEAEGIDLAGYNVKECARDVAAIARGLGYEQITLVGTSFGSQWSFAILRMEPGLVARALLSGVEPLDHGYDMPSHVFAACQRMWTSVDGDPLFAPYLPDGGMAEVFEVLMDRFEEGPIELAVTKGNPGSPGTQRTVTIRPADLPLQEPAALLELFHGRADRWLADPPPEPDGTRAAERPLVGPLIDSSLGVTPHRRLRLWTDPATRFLGRENFALYLATADIWPSPDVGDDFRTPVVCRVPVVFAQGNWDTSTPIENTYEIAPFFVRSRVLVADRGGHGVIEPIRAQLPGVWKELEEFLKTGDLEGIPPQVQLLQSRRFAPPAFALAKDGR